MGVIFCFALVAVGDSGARYDAAAHLLEARGAAAADLRAPSAAIARVKAERTARQRAEKKLAAALAALNWRPCRHAAPSADGGACDPTAARDQLLAAATVADEQFGSDGSVTLTLSLPTIELDLKKK